MPKFCEKCGAPLAPGKMFCEDCGAPVENPSESVRVEQAASPSEQPAPPQTSTPPQAAPAKSPPPAAGPARPVPKTALIGIIVIILIVVVASVVFLIPKASPEPLVGSWTDDHNTLNYVFYENGSMIWWPSDMMVAAGSPAVIHQLTWVKTGTGRYLLTAKTGQTKTVIFDSSRDFVYFDDDPGKTYSRSDVSFVPPPYAVSQPTAQPSITMAGSTGTSSIPAMAASSTTAPGTTSPPPMTAVTTCPTIRPFTPGTSGLKYASGDIVQGLPGDTKSIILDVDPVKKKYSTALVAKYQDEKYHVLGTLDWNHFLDAAMVEEANSNKIDHIDPCDVVVDRAT
jgi:hypothetical protein